METRLGKRSRRRTSAVIALILLGQALLAGCSDDNEREQAAAAADHRAASFHGELKQTGRWFTDPQGRVVTLHGVNITVPQYPDDTDLAELYRDDAQFLVSLGHNTVRVALFLSGLVPAPDTYNARYFDNLARLAEMLTGAGLYVILDLHQDVYANRYHGRGMPEWMAVDNGLPVQPDAGNLFLNYAAGLAVMRAFDNFWLNANAPDGTPLQTHYARALQQLALKFRDNPAVLGYEFMNEPFPGTQFATCASPLGCPVFDQLFLTPFSQRMAQAVREVDRRKIVFYEPNVTFDFGANTWHGDIGDDNAALSFHDYCLGNQFGDFPVDNSPPCEQLGERPQFSYALAHANQYNKALILTEFGHFTGALTTDTSPVVRRMARIADDYMVPWAYWHYDGESSYSLVKDPAQPLAGENMYPIIISAVTRVYPRAIAGTPRSWSYDPKAKIFTLGYDTARVDGVGHFEEGGITEIFVPLQEFPDGYEAEVEGGRVISAPQAALLRVGAPPTSYVKVMLRSESGRK